jgi:ribosomal protein S18 acetylase RimI-like enzyme
VRQHVPVIIDVSPPQNSPLLATAVRKFRQVEAGESFADSSGPLAFVEMQGPEIAGWCWGYHLPRPDAFSMIYLHDIEVDEPYRRRGVGRRLMEAFMDAGRRAGAAKMFLTTGEANMPARRLYEGLGGGLASQGQTVNYGSLFGRRRALPTVGDITAMAPARRCGSRTNASAPCRSRRRRPAHHSAETG